MVDAPPTRPVEPVGGFGKVSKGDGLTMSEAAVLAQLGYADSLATITPSATPELDAVPNGHRRHIVLASALSDSGASKVVIGITREGVDYDLAPNEVYDGTVEGIAFLRNITLKAGDVLYAYDMNAAGNITLVAAYTDIKVRR